MQAGIEWIGGLIAAGLLPVSQEGASQPIHHLRRIALDAEFAAQVEGAAVDVHRTGLGVMAIHQNQLGMELEVLLAPHLDPEALHDPQGGEGVVDVPVADAVLAAAEQAHLHTPLPGADDAIEDHRIHELGMLDPEGAAGGVDDAGHLAAAMGATPDQTDVEIGLEEGPVPIRLEAGNHLGHNGGIG